MGKLIDLTGQHFDMLTVLKRYPENTKDNRAQWVCKCDCGNEVIYPGRTLIIGKATSCGCKHKKDLTNQKFGQLTVLEYAYSKNGARYWKCLCDCGNITYVPSYSLTSGNTQSCGCLHSKVLKESNIKLKSKIDQDDIIGKRFDYLEVVELVESEGRTVYKCYCHNCGNYKNVKYSDLVSGKVHACGCLLSWAESQLKELFNKYNINYITQFKFNDLISEKGIPLRFDFAIFKNTNLYCLIEYQGVQHFDNQNPYWTPLLEKHDLMKKQYCLNNNIKLIELTKQDDLKKFTQEIAKEILS